MTGIEKITQTIIERAESEAAGIISSAEEKAKSIRAESAERAQVERSVIIDEAKKKAALIEHIGQSGAKTGQQRTMLLARQEIIGSVIDKAVDKLRSLDDKSYFEVIKRLIVSHADKGEGELLFSRKDRARIPAGFVEDVNASLGGGKTVRLAQDTFETGGGVILRYGGIEENCSFEALALEKREALADSLQNVLFG